MQTMTDDKLQLADNGLQQLWANVWAEEMNIFWR